MLELTLPYPPSVNSYWRSVPVGRKVQVLISEKGRRFRADVRSCVLLAKAARQYSGRLQVQVSLHPADARRRDIDNCLKSLLDALGHAGVYLDDSQIDALSVCRKYNKPGGECVVRIMLLDSTC
ncbi:RusA family crossover junction endodeoxyribonuclease [Arsukibacterium sp.]|uniref:RusA family crossover junction endodeoxyribonuclease n=1 Tax=Arsukibacterium sp. TaxID=1977258 RepID=UPI00299F202B|nr:RusA family crossover junction endodeoxyribonuclease [Arsukibacterium sp.]MDX1538842.1 RusA family crossover junction endodeoxyribonuclease [Arsukibacterium sp.]